MLTVPWNDEQFWRHRNASIVFSQLAVGFVQAAQVGSQGMACAASTTSNKCQMQML
jgi:ABC-type taurine transport system substrate-binding protein